MFRNSCQANIGLSILSIINVFSIAYPMIQADRSQCPVALVDRVFDYDGVDFQPCCGDFWTSCGDFEAFYGHPFPSSFSNSKLLYAAGGIPISRRSPQPMRNSLCFPILVRFETRSIYFLIEGNSFSETFARQR